MDSCACMEWVNTIGANTRLTPGTTNPTTTFIAFFAHSAAEQVNAATLLPDCASAEPRERFAEQCWPSNSRSAFYAASGPGSSSGEPPVALVGSAAGDLR